MTEENVTLEVWRNRALILFGEDSKAVAFLDRKIKETNKDDKVIIDEAQMLHVLAQIEFPSAGANEPGAQKESAGEPEAQKG